MEAVDQRDGLRVVELHRADADESLRVLLHRRELRRQSESKWRGSGPCRRMGRAARPSCRGTPCRRCNGRARPPDRGAESAPIGARRGGSPAAVSWRRQYTSVPRSARAGVLLSASMKRLVLSIFLCGALFAQAPASGPSALAPDRVARIDALLNRYVEEGRSPRSGRARAARRQAGVRDGRRLGDKEAGRKMTTDTIFRIASQTKAITSTAVLTLVEEGQDRNRPSRWATSSRLSRRRRLP